jgi:hypothetical protein
MTIKGFSEPKRIPRVGKIYLGMKTQNDNGKTYPTATDYFLVRSDGVNTSDGAAEAFYKAYGPEPREITVAFPSDDPDNFMPQYLASYRGGGGRHELWCKGDGIVARRADGAGGYTEMQCEYRDCPIFQEGKCKELTRLLFLLPEVEGIGVWELDTTSYHSAQNLVSSIQLIRQLTRGKIAMIPLKLRVVPKVVNPDGRTKTIYVLDLKLENIKLMDLLNRIPQLGVDEPMQLVEPINHNEMPDDLYIESTVVTDADINRVETQGVEVAPANRPPQTNRTERTAPPSGRTRSQERIVDDAQITDDTADDADIHAFCTVAFKKHTNDQYVALVKLASQKGEVVEVVTTDWPLLTKLKTVKEGQTVRCKWELSQQFVNRKEITDFAIVS